MKGKLNQQVLFIFCLIIATLSASWIIFTLIYDIYLIFTNFIYQFVLIILCFSFSISVISIHEIQTEIKSKILEEKEIQKSVSDFYQYTQLLDPPEMNT